MSADRADLARSRENAARAKYLEVEREVEREAKREGVPLEREPANGAYTGRAKVRVIAAGITLLPEGADSPKHLQSRWWKARENAKA